MLVLHIVYSLVIIDFSFVSKTSEIVPNSQNAFKTQFCKYIYIYIYMGYSLAFSFSMLTRKHGGKKPLTLNLKIWY